MNPASGAKSYVGNAGVSVVEGILPVFDGGADVTLRHKWETSGKDEFGYNSVCTNGYVLQECVTYECVAHKSGRPFLPVK